MATEDAPTKDAKKLVRRDYAGRVLASLGEQRAITDQFIRSAIGDFNPDAVSIMDLRRMRRDPMIKMGLHYTKAPLIRAEWAIKCEDPEIREGMTEIVRRVRQSWMRSALNMLDFGYQAAVKQFELGSIDANYEDKDSGDVKDVWPHSHIQPVVIGAPIPLPPEMAKVKLDKGRFDGIQTTLAPITGNASDDNAHVPSEWSLWFTNEFEEEFRNYYGVSRILPAYEPWYAFWFTFHMRNRHIENDADPPLQVWYPPGSFVPDPTDIDPETDQPRVQSNRDAALQIGHLLRGGSTIAWPSDVHVDEQGKSTAISLWRAEFLRGGENLGVFNDVLNDLRIEKLRACLVPEQALVEAMRGTSSRNAAATYVDIFTESQELTAKYLDEIWNRHQLRAVVEANWGKDAPKCEIETTGFQSEDLELVNGLITSAFNADPNALPINWEEMVERAGLPMYTAAEQAEREKAAAEAQAEAQANQPPPEQGGAPGEVGPLPGEAPQTPDQLAASQDRFRVGPRKYERETIHLGGHSHQTVKSTAPGWARREGARRDRNVAALAERLGGIAYDMYAVAFQAAAEAVADDEISLSLSAADAINSLVTKVRERVRAALGKQQPAVQGEAAGVYHVAGAAELTRLGLSGESWDVGRDEVQEWARFRAGELVKTIEGTVVEKHVRPWLASVLQDPQYGSTFVERAQGIPVDTMSLAQQLTDHFQNYPLWMAERLVRTEARMGYNQSALDMWERVGVQQVQAFDGLGGKSGKTDEHCLRRNGRTFTLDEARDEDRQEHPNGTLGFIPVTVGVDLKPLRPGVVGAYPALTASIYAIDPEDGLILSEAETGELLAGQS